MAKKAAVLGTFDIENIGDLLFPLVTRDRLATQGIDVVFVSPKGGARVLSDAEATISVEEFVERAAEFDLVILGGGNLIHAEPWNANHYRTDGPRGRMAYQRLWLGAGMAAYRAGIPLCWNAPGVPRELSEPASRYLRWVIEHSTYVSVRDTSSQSRIAAGTGHKAIVAPDAAWDIARVRPMEALAPRAEKLLQDLGLGSPFVVVHVNRRYGGDDPTAVAAQLRQLSDATGVTPLLLPMAPCHGDAGTAYAVHAELGEHAHVHLPSAIDDVIALFSRSEGYVGSSMHGAILALSYGKPAVVVAAEGSGGLDKFSGMFGHFGLREYVTERWADAAALLGRELSDVGRDFGWVLPAAIEQLDTHWAALLDVLMHDAHRDAHRAQRSDAISGFDPAPDFDTALREMWWQMSGVESSQPTIEQSEARRRAAEQQAKRLQELLDAQVAAVKYKDAEVAELERSVRRLEDDLYELGNLIETAATSAAEMEAEARRARTESGDAAEYRSAASVRMVPAEALREAVGAMDLAVRSRSWRWARRLAYLRRRVMPGAPKHEEGALELAAARLRETLAAAESRSGGQAAPSRTDEGTAGPGQQSAQLRVPGRRALRSGGSGEKPSLAVVAWDVGHNPFGRAHLLADMMCREYDVEIVGSQFPRYGSSIWQPLRNQPMPVRTIAGSEFPEYFDSMAMLASTIEADAVYVSKARMPSVAIGALVKERDSSRPVIVDVDDLEVAFVGAEDSQAVPAVHDLEGDPDARMPFGRLWTSVAQGVVGDFDGVTVSNPALQLRFGGDVVPHARDETVFDPARLDREYCRRRLGFGADDVVLLFGGTARPHKGLEALISAITRLGDRRVRLAVFDTAEYRSMRSAFGESVRVITELEPVPFDQLPEVVRAADLVCLPQDPKTTIAQHQMPAKLTDALAMAVPCLATPTPPLQPLIDAGVVAPLGSDLVSDLRRAVAELDSRSAAAQEEGRAYFEEHLSYAAVRPKVVELFDRASADPRPLGNGARAAIAVQRQWSNSEVTPALKRRRRTVHDEPMETGPIDVVVFWKQNDSGLYGRRQDMLTEYLSRDSRVRKVVHFDEPMSTASLMNRACRVVDRQSQESFVAMQTLRRHRGRAHEGKVRRYVFLYGDRPRLGLPRRDGYGQFVRSVLENEKVGVGAPVAMVLYPRNFDFAELVDVVQPDVLVADIVDDHRSWYAPGDPMREKLTDNYREILTVSDLCITNCGPLAERMSEFDSAVHILPNAAEPPTARFDVPPRQLRGIERPIIGYVGNLSSRIDLELLHQAIRSRPEWSWVFVGSTHLERDALDLGRHSNVHLLGVQPHELARSIAAHFDVAIIPHVVNEMTAFMNPLKAYVYVGLGLPVVSTPIPNLPQSDMIRTAGSAESFVEAIQEALRDGQRNLEQTAAQLQGELWPDRVDSLLEQIAKRMPQGQARVETATRKSEPRMPTRAVTAPRRPATAVASRVARAVTGDRTISTAGREGDVVDDWYDGICRVCGTEGRFEKRARSIRETYRCNRCRASLRYQGQAQALLDAYGGRDRGAFSLADLISFPDFAGLRILEPGVLGPFRELLSPLRGYETCEYWPDVPPGDYRDGVRCEDLTSLTYPDETFDLVITSDIFEHVRHPLIGFEEVCRVLVPGGRHVFSVPVAHPLPVETVWRVDTSGPEDIHLLEPRYHSGPRNGRHLVYTDFGADVVEMLEQIGLSTTIEYFEAPSLLASRLVTFVSTRIV